MSMESEHLTPGAFEDVQSLRPGIVREHSPASIVRALSALSEIHLERESARPITGISMDSRAVRTGDLYVALPGAKVHGASFAQAAVDAQASAILTDRAGYELMQQRGIDLSDCSILLAEDIRPLVGPAAALIYGSAGQDTLTPFAVTGTNGKTTTTYMLESVLRRALSYRTGLVGTIQILVDGASVPSTMTTPESVHVHSLLSLMGERGLDAVAMEVSSHAIDYHRVDGVKYRFAGFTNLTQDHLDLHGTMEDYFASKAQLFTPSRCQQAVITVDDSWGERMADTAVSQLGEQNVYRLYTGRGAGASLPEGSSELDWAVVDVEREGLGHRFALLSGSGERVECLTFLPADFNVSNAALAALLAYLHADEAQRPALRAALADGSALTPVVPGRMQLISTAPHAIVDFAHNPDGLTRALEAMDRPGAGRVIIVFGATGERDQLKRPIMGEIAARHADIVIVTDDDPHGEDPAPIREQVVAGAQAAQAEGARAAEILNISPREDAIAQAVRLAGAADSILIAGRGHETVQEVDGTNIALDDRLETARALLANGYSVLPDYAAMVENATKNTN